MREHELTGKKTQLNPEKISKQRVKRVPTWKKLLSASITDVETLAKACKYKIDKEKLKKVIERYPMRINPYYLSLIEDVNDPIWKQCMPDEKEITNQEGYEDPLLEEKYSPVPGITHRYPDRVLFLVSNQCAMYCRFCTRKRRVGHPFKRITREQIMRGINYISKHKEIRDVLLSGGTRDRPGVL